MQDDFQPGNQPNQPDVAPIQNSQATDTMPTTATEPKKSQKRLLVSMLILFAAIVMASALYLTLVKDSSEPSKNLAETTPKKSQTDAIKTPDKTATMNAVSVIAKTISDTGGKNTSGAENSSLPAVKVEGYSFYSVPLSSVAVSVSFPREQAELVSTYTKAKQSLEKQGFSGKQTLEGEVSDTPNYKFFNSAVNCSVYPLVAKTGQKNIVVSCANASSYQDTAAKLKPFYDIYAQQSSSAADGSLVMNDNTFVQSKTAGYKYVSYNIGSIDGGGGFAGLFYMTPDQKWHYFTGAQQQLYCARYDSEEIRKAYLGTACWTSTGQDSTVTL